MTLEEFLLQWNSDSPYITIHTSGTTGIPKSMEVEKECMRVSARITYQFLHLKPGDTALLCLPLDYIAGKMMVVRALVARLHLLHVQPSSHPLASLFSPESKSTAIDFAAMIPMQVAHSLENPKEKEILQNIKHLIIGGGSIDTSLENSLKEFPNSIWSTYGMTETLSHIALRRINGDNASSWYTPFDHVSVSLDRSHCLVVQANGICNEPLCTHDIAEIHPDGRRFRIIGRIDNVVCSGGIKIHMEEVENKLAPFLLAPFLITKTSDPIWGECVTLLSTNDNMEEIKEICRNHLPKHWIPKRYYTIPAIPFTSTGKIARKEAIRIAEKCMRNNTFS